MLSQSPGIPGPTPRVAALLEGELSRLGHTVATHSWGRSRTDDGLVARGLGTLRDIRSVLRMARREAFDVALVHTAHDWRTLLRDIPLSRALRRRKLPVVLHLHGSRPECLGVGGRRAFRAATWVLLRSVDAVLVLSREEQKQWTAFGSPVPVFVVRNPYASCAEASPPVESPRADRPTILYVGRLIREKGVLDLVEAMPRVVARASCRLVLVGEGPCAQELRERVRAHGLTAHVDFAGFLTDRDELERAYAEADIFVLPSHSEGFATVLAEAMDAALPIVTTRIRGAVDYLAEGENVLFVEPGDMDGLAAALMALLEDRSLRLRMGDANRRRVSVFAPSIVVSDYIGALERVTLHPRTWGTRP